MNRWGVGGCRENIETICGWMEEDQLRWGWANELKAAAAAFSTGIAFRLDTVNPIRSLVDLAIKRAH
ncbi:hypothetical protein [Anatilimnocola aggregata]|nr:hypothetical protein [Anatilimnocola aggregata]